MDLEKENVFQEIKAESESFWDFKGELDFVDKWFLMSSPIPVGLITIAYLLFVVKLGPDLMKNRKPYSLTNVLLVYNAFQVIFSIYMFSLCIKLQWPLGFIHKTCNMETEEARLLITSTHYIYFISKLTELLDTVFFVLRKKHNQVSFLHVYHHAFVLVGVWSVLKYEPGYSLVLVATINSLVHMIMYTYYGLSAFPSMTKYLWWKKYITRLQLTQFLIIFINFSMNQMWSECKQSKILTFIIFFNLLLFKGLFAKFYVEAYIKNNDKKNKDKIKMGKEFENRIKKGDSDHFNQRTNDRKSTITEKRNLNANTNEQNHPNKKRNRPLGENVQSR